MNALITHECSGEVRRAFRALGHAAWSCDLVPSEDGSPCHLVMDAVDAMRRVGPASGLPEWDIIICHPPCTYLSVSGIHWNDRGRGWERTEEAVDHFVRCAVNARANARVGSAIENPVGIMSSRWRKADQYVQPFRFGDDASKQTGLWLDRLPWLEESAPGNPGYVSPRWVCPKCKCVRTDAEARLWKKLNGRYGCSRCSDAPNLLPRWGNQTDSGQNRLGPSATRAADRARTYPGIARAMAAQWSRFALSA